MIDTFVVENLSLPDELQKMLDQRISMNMVGDMNKYTQFQVAQSMPIAAANEGGGRCRHRRGAGRGNGDGKPDDDERRHPSRPPPNRRRRAHRLQQRLPAAPFPPSARYPTPSSAPSAASTSPEARSSVPNAASHSSRRLRPGMDRRSSRLLECRSCRSREAARPVRRPGGSDVAASCRRGGLASISPDWGHYRALPACRIAPCLSYFSRVRIDLSERVLLPPAARLGFRLLSAALLRRHSGERPPNRAAF